MIDVAYCQVLARYNRWMNERMFAAVATLADDVRKRDRGAFFGSIHRTLDHILWGDRVWLGRFTGDRHAVVAYGADVHPDFADLAREREAADRDILGWAGALAPAWLASTLEYRAASDGKLRRMPAWIAATHLFQHATHHRGQVTTMMRQAGVDPGVTDLPFMPGVARVIDDDA
ncbi:MAG: DinB family protein [Betaproteobacteria bacterium]